MIRMSIKTKKSNAAIRKESEHYFGRTGLKLIPKEPFNFCAYFEGDNGYVAVDILNKKGVRIIDVQSMGSEYHALQFLHRF